MIDLYYDVARHLWCRCTAPSESVYVAATGSRLETLNSLRQKAVHPGTIAEIEAAIERLAERGYQ